jgi:hypothetical protein
MNLRNKSEPAHQQTFVIVNKPALDAWLHAWTTGESFSLRTGSGKTRERTYSTNRGNRLPRHGATG